MEKYLITATGTPFGEPSVAGARVDDPKEALRLWFAHGERNPTCVSLRPRSAEDGMALLRWAAENRPTLEAWAKRHKCPYRIDWLCEEVAKAVGKGRCSM